MVFREVLHPIELELNVFDERGKPENAEKKLLEQSKEPTTNNQLNPLVVCFQIQFNLEET